MAGTIETETSFLTDLAHTLITNFNFTPLLSKHLDILAMPTVAEYVGDEYGLVDLLLIHLDPKTLPEASWRRMILMQPLIPTSMRLGSERNDWRCKADD